MAYISSVTLPDGTSYDIKGKSAEKAERLQYSHGFNGSSGWYLVMQLSFIVEEGASIDILINSLHQDIPYGIIHIGCMNNQSGRVYNMKWLSAPSETIRNYVKWEYDSSNSKINIYAYKDSNYGYIAFLVLSASLRNSSGSYIFNPDLTSNWKNESVSDVSSANYFTGPTAQLDANGDQIDTTYLKKTETAHSSYTLFPTKVYPGSLAIGWYKFAEVNITGNSGRAKITFKYGAANASFDFIGDIFVYKESSIPLNCTMQIPYIASGKTTYFRYNVDSNTKVSLYFYKYDNGGYPVFTILTSQNEFGNYLDPSTYMLETLVSETPPATALKPYYSSISRWINNVPVSPGTNQQILSYSNGMITASTVLAKVEFANPEYIKSDCSWQTTDGANPSNSGTITLTGTCTTATTANLLLLNVMVA